MKTHITKLVKNQSLTSDEAEDAMMKIMSGQASPAQIGGYLGAMSLKGETIEEIAGSLKALRKSMVVVNTKSGGEELVDIVGTGGDNSNTFNISTAAAFIVAGAGQKVAKHGNRSSSSQCGSADVLEALGVKLEMTPEQVAYCIDEIGIGYMFTPMFHPAARYASGPRKELGIRTIFNICGPLANPALARFQLVGVYSAHLTYPLAVTLGRLGSNGAFVVHGFGGWDELSTNGSNTICYYRRGEVEKFALDPDRFELRKANIDEIKGGSPNANAQRMLDLFSGKDKSTLRDVVILNAAAALFLVNTDWSKSIRDAINALDSGVALEKLQTLISVSNK